jgi:serine O-acetyltransferase
MNHIIVFSNLQKWKKERRTMSRIVYLLYLISHWLYVRKVPFIPKLFSSTIRIVFAGWIPASARIGKNCRFGKGALGIVLHERVVIGDCCIIGPNVTIGGSSEKEKNRLPVIGNRVRVGANSVVLGNITIGNEVIIAAGAVVINDVPPKSIVAGNPAKIIKSNIDINELVTFKC